MGETVVRVLVEGGFAVLLIVAGAIAVRWLASRIDRVEALHERLVERVMRYFGLPPDAEEDDAERRRKR